MQAYTCNLVIGKNKTLTLKNLPFNAGEELQIIVIPSPQFNRDQERYPFWGKPIQYINPTDSISEVDWEVLK